MSRLASIKANDKYQQEVAANILGTNIDPTSGNIKKEFVPEVMKQDKYITEAYLSEFILPKVSGYVQQVKNGVPVDAINPIATAVRDVLAVVDMVIQAISREYSGIPDDVKMKISRLIKSLDDTNGKLPSGAVRFSTDDWAALSSDGVFNKTEVARKIIAILNQISRSAASEAEYESYFNAIPEFRFTSFGLDEDGVLSSQVEATDTNGDPITFEVLTAAAAIVGNFTLNSNGSFVYAPPQDYYGNVSILVNASDSYGGYAMQNITFTVNSVNDNPVAISSKVIIPISATNFTIKLNATDVDNNISKYIILSNTSSLTLENFNETSGEALYNGSLLVGANDTMIFFVKDEDGANSNNATITFIADCGLTFRTDQESIKKAFAFYANSKWHADTLRLTSELVDLISTKTLTENAQNDPVVVSLFEEIKSKGTNITLAPSRELFPSDDPFCFGLGTASAKFLGKTAKYSNSGSPATVGRFCVEFNEIKLKTSDGFVGFVYLSLADLKTELEQLAEKLNATILAERSSALQFALPESTTPGAYCPDGYSEDSLENCYPDSGSSPVGDVLGCGFTNGSGLCPTGAVNNSLAIYTTVC